MTKLQNKVSQILADMWIGAKMTLSGIYFLFAVYGAYQFMLHYEDVAIALNLIAKK